MVEKILFLTQKTRKYYQQLRIAYRTYRDLKSVIPQFFQDKKDIPFCGRRLLIGSMGWYGAKDEAIYAKALEALGYDICVLTPWDPFVEKIFKVFGIKKIYFYHHYYKRTSFRKLKDEAKAIIAAKDPQSFLEINKQGVEVGKYAASLFMRMTRSSSFQQCYRNKQTKSLLVKYLAESLRAADIAHRAIKEIKPTLTLVNDRGYTPMGQFFDKSLNFNIPVIQFCASHKSGSQILKRYSSFAMSRIHPHSLSQDSWQQMKAMPWTEQMRLRVYSELEKTYTSGDWFSETGTQFNKRVYTKEELIARLRINLHKRTAIVFPHMFWDATFFWGKDLFDDYYDWFVNVLKVAKENTNLNWIIKIHPANVVKARRDSYRGLHRELEAVYEILGEIPAHIKIVTPENDINTFSLYSLADYCLTVRGTVGIEAAAYGILTLTAGTGRYDRLGFTVDFDSSQEYLECLKNLQEMPSMTQRQIELACRYAYGIFILRPIYFDILDYKFQQDKQATMKFLPLFKTRQEYEESDFVKKFQSFVSSEKEDFMNEDLCSAGGKICVE